VPTLPLVDTPAQRPARIVAPACAAPPAEAAGSDWRRALQQHDDEPAARRWLTLLIVLLHGAALWALLQFEPVREAVRAAAPVFVDFIAPPPAPTAPAPKPPPSPVQTRAPVITPPALAAAPVLAAPPAPQPEPANTVTPAPPSPPEVPAAPPAIVASPAPPAPPPPARKTLPASAVQYLVLPPAEVPRLSRRAGESGTVWLRVVVDTRGLPLQVSVQRSSGFARLDQQALGAMRLARFKPQTENGQPIELEVLAPIEYTLE